MDKVYILTDRQLEQIIEAFILECGGEYNKYDISKLTVLNTLLSLMRSQEPIYLNTNKG